MLVDSGLGVLQIESCKWTFFNSYLIVICGPLNKWIPLNGEHAKSHFHGIYRFDQPPLHVPRISI